MDKRLIFLAVLLVGLLLPTSMGETFDISGDGTHLLKVMYVDGNYTIVIDDNEFTIDRYVYSIDGNGSVLVLTDIENIYYYSYNGTFIAERPAASGYYPYSLAIDGSTIYFVTRHNGSIGIYEDPFNPRMLLNGSQLELQEIYDIEAYNGHIYFIGYKNETEAYLYEYYDNNVTMISEVVNATYLAIINGELYVYDYNGAEVKKIKIIAEEEGKEGGGALTISVPEPKPIEEVSAPEATAATTAASAGVVSYLYLIRERRLTALSSFRRIIKKRYKKDILLLLPIAGRIFEVAVMPYKSILSFLVLTALSISGGYGLYGLIRREFRRRFKRLSAILMIYSIVMSFYTLMIFTRRYAVVAFYLLSFIYAVATIKMVAFFE